MLETKLLCVDPKLHKLKMTPVLVRELRRRSILNGDKAGVFFTKSLIAKPFSTVTFYTRPLNIRKVVGTGFIRLPPEVDISVIEQSYKSPPLADI